MDDTLQLCFLCAHPSLTPAYVVALTLRAVGGLTTRQIARAYLVSESTMAQRISRAKRTVSRVRFDQPGDVATMLRVLDLVFNEGCSGDVDLAARQSGSPGSSSLRATATLQQPSGSPASGARPHRGPPVLGVA